MCRNCSKLLQGRCDFCHCTRASVPVTTAQRHENHERGLILKIATSHRAPIRPTAKSKYSILVALFVLKHARTSHGVSNEDICVP